MSLPLDAPPAISETATRKERRNASILTLLAERLKQAANLATALPEDWREGAAVPLAARQANRPRTHGPRPGARSPPRMKKTPAALTGVSENGTAITRRRRCMRSSAFCKKHAQPG
jgi:hypothetical protein